MRIWHYALLSTLPDRQFKGQLRELIAIMRDWKSKGSTNHLLINKVMQYPKSHLTKYIEMYAHEYEKRYGKEVNLSYLFEFVEFSKYEEKPITPFTEWHNHEYLRCNMANLYEKWKFASGNSKLTDNEWKILTLSYKTETESS